MYYLTIKKNGEVILSKEAFDDYAAAVAHASRFYHAKSNRSVLKFTTEVINGEFARSYATLTQPEDINRDSPFYKERYHAAVKNVNAFSFNGSYLFMIESEIGVRDAERMRAEFEDEG